MDNGARIQFWTSGAKGIRLAGLERSAMAAQEQRKYPRVKPPKSVVVAWQAGMQRGVSYVESLGLGGLFVRTKTMIPLRSLVVILLDMPVGQVRGRAIVRNVTAEKGIGVQIIAMDQEDRARLQRQLQDLIPAT